MAKLPMEAPSSKLMVSPEASCRKLQPGPLGGSRSSCCCCCWVFLRRDVVKDIDKVSFGIELADNGAGGVSSQRSFILCSPLLLLDGVILSSLVGGESALVLWSNGSSHKRPFACKDTLILVGF